MLEHINTTKKDPNWFIMYFVDKSKKDMSDTHYRRLKWYNAYDKSEINVKINVNSIAGTFIDVTVVYPSGLIESSKELDELIKMHEKNFQEFYKDSLSY